MKRSNRTTLSNWKVRAFTLVEVITVVGIISISLPVVFSILTTIVTQQGKVFRLTEAKQQGDYAVSFIRNYIRENGEAIYYDVSDEGQFSGELCGVDSTQWSNATQTGKEFHFQDGQQPESYFRIYNERVQIETADGGVREISQVFLDEDGSIQALTTNTVKIENFSMECYRKNAFGGPFIRVSFLIYYTGNSDSFDINTAPPEELALLNYQTVVQLFE